MASKNNPALRDNQRLLVYCPNCDSPEKPVEMTVVKRIPGGMFYVCAKCGGSHQIAKKSYMNFRHMWTKQK